MCAPVVAAAVVAAGVMKGVGDKMGADAAADAERNNAIISEEAASQALSKGVEDAGRVQMRGAALQGAQRAGYGTSGADVNLGSAARTQENTAMLTAIDKQTAMNNARREAWGLVKQAQNMRSHADSVEAGGWLSLGGDVIGSVGNASTLFAGPKAKAPGK